MKRTLVALTAGLILLSLAGCSLSLLRKATPVPTFVSLPSPTALAAIPTTAAPTPTATMSLPTVTLGAPLPAAGFKPTATVGGIVPGSPSGPYGVIQVAAGEVLNIRSAPSVESTAIGSFASTANNVMRTGPSSSVAGALWVEVQNPNGGNGWVNAVYLTEYIPPASFCADARVSTLVANFGNAFKTSNGGTLASLVSPAHGWTVRLWHNGNAITFDREHAQWVFISTYKHNWGAAPGSGQDTVGAIHVIVLPKLLDVFNAPAPGYTLSCNTVQAGGASYDTSWPVQYANVNYYSVYKPGPAGNELSWRTLLIGVEYVQNQPYIFSTTQLDWEP
jgi:hypothetical protein